MANVSAMHRWEFDRLPHRKWDEDIGEFDSLIILPSKVHYHDILFYKARCILAKLLRYEEPNVYTVKGLHDSGYRCMDFVAVRGEEPVCQLSGCSDVIHIDGIGGFGYDWLHKYNTVPKLVPPHDWSIDCLPVSGLLRLFCRGKMLVGTALSSFEIYHAGGNKDE